MNCMFFVNDTASTGIYTYCHYLALHDGLPILKRCPAPVMRRLVAPRTSAASSSSLCGRATCPFAVTLPDQLLHAICLAPASGLKAVAGEKVSQDYILSAEGQRTPKHDIPDINDNMPAPKTIA